MLCRILAALTGGLLLFCASVPAEFRPFRACVMSNEGGRSLMDVGLVVGEAINEDGRHVYRFQPDRLPRDGMHIKEVIAVNRFCAPAQGGSADYSAEESHAPHN